VRGSIDIGKMADFVILDHDIMACPLKEIPTVNIMMTVIAGEKVYNQLTVNR
jgi:hypothetical protein